MLGDDVKIVAKRLARRSEVLLPDLIKPDQTGFVKARFGTDNVRRALNIINQLGRIKDPALIVSLDAEKAFDRVECKLLYAVLEKVNLGYHFINLAKMYFF